MEKENTIKMAVVTKPREVPHMMISDFVTRARYAQRASAVTGYGETRETSRRNFRKKLARLLGVAPARVRLA